MEIPNPRRILILSPPSTALDTLINALTTPPPSTTPPPPSPPSPFNHHIRTPYYRATIPIWTDSIPSAPAFHAEWLALPGAADVVSAIGAWIVAFHKPVTAAELQSTQTLLTTIASIITHHLSSFSSTAIEPPALFAVALPQHQLPHLQLEDAAWEDMCRDSGGWEFVDGEAGGGGVRNEFGEMVGLPRLLEALETVEWDADGGEGDEGGDEGSGNEEEEGVLEGLEGWEEGGMREPMMAEDVVATERGAGRRTGDAEMGGGSGFEGSGNEDLDGEDEGDLEVQALQHMMLKMQAVKEMGADLPEGERRKLAARAVREVMRGV